MMLCESGKVSVRFCFKLHLVAVYWHASHWVGAEGKSEERNTVGRPSLLAEVG